MATIKFILRMDKGNTHGENPIYAQYIHLGSKAVFATGKKVSIKSWDFDQCKVIKHENALALNGFLGKFAMKINKIVIDLQQADYEPTATRVKEAFLRLEDEKKPEVIFTKSILFLWDEYLNSRINSLAPRTINSLKNSIESLKKFLKQAKEETLTPEKFTIKHLVKWEDFLNKYSKPNTVAKRLKHLKSFLKYYEELGGKCGVPLTKIKYKETAGVKVSLSESELEAFARIELSGRLDEIRDLFVLQCNTGLRISDLQRIDKNIIGDRIKITTQKTRVNLEIPISPPVRKILEKYSYQLPRIPEQKINLEIKNIFKKLFPEEKMQIRNKVSFEEVLKGDYLSTHDAIRTFITLSIERGMSVTSIAKITGKSIAVLIKHYLSESQKVAEKDFIKAWG